MSLPHLVSTWELNFIINRFKYVSGINDQKYYFGHALLQGNKV